MLFADRKTSSLAIKLGALNERVTAMLRAW